MVVNCLQILLDMVLSGFRVVSGLYSVFWLWVCFFFGS